MPYAVQTPVFEGPFDLLLHLILSEQVDLYEIRLATIVDGYLVELERMEDLNLDVASEFLLSMKEFPPSQAPGDWSLESLEQQIRNMSNSGK